MCVHSFTLYNDVVLTEFFISLFIVDNFNRYRVKDFLVGEIYC